MDTIIKICQWINDNVELFSTTIGSILIAWGFLYKVKKKAGEAHDEFRALFSLPAKIDEISKQLMTNGGSTLRDAIARIEYRQCVEAEKVKILLNNADRMCFECNAMGECSYVNMAYLKILDCVDTDALGHNWRNLIHPEDREDVVKEWEAAVKDKRDFEYKFRYLTKKDKVIYAHCKAQVVHDHKGSIVGWFGVVKEIDSIPNEWST